MRSISDIQKMVYKEPNDQSLGEAIRKLFNTDDPKHYRICISCGRWQSDLNDTCKFCGKKLNAANSED